MADFKNLIVWQRAHALNLRVAHAAARIRGATYTSLRSQMVRAAMSIPANIVEGRDQPTDRGFSKFLRIAINSGNELEYHLITARDLGLLAPEEFSSLMIDLREVLKMLHGLLTRIG